MGYNVTRNVVKRNLPQLEKLFESKENVRFPTERPPRLAYKLREALNASQHFDEYEHLYSFIYPNYQFRNEPGAVVAIYIGTSDYEQGVTKKEAAQKKNETHRPPKKIVPDAINVVDVVGAALKYDAESEIHFPKANLNPKEKTRLYKWTLDTNWQYIDHSLLDGQGGLTLTKNEVSSAVLFSPRSSEAGKEDTPWK